MFKVVPASSLTRTAGILSTALSAAVFSGGCAYSPASELASAGISNPDLHQLREAIRKSSSSQLSTILVSELNAFERHAKANPIQSQDGYRLVEKIKRSDNKILHAALEKELTDRSFRQFSVDEKIKILDIYCAISDPDTYRYLSHLLQVYRGETPLLRTLYSDNQTLLDKLWGLFKMPETVKASTEVKRALCDGLIQLVSSPIDESQHSSPTCADTSQSCTLWLTQDERLLNTLITVIECGEVRSRGEILLRYDFSEINLKPSKEDSRTPIEQLTQNVIAAIGHCEKPTEMLVKSEHYFGEQDEQFVRSFSFLTGLDSKIKPLIEYWKPYPEQCENLPFGSLINTDWGSARHTVVFLRQVNVSQEAQIIIWNPQGCPDGSKLGDEIHDDGPLRMVVDPNGIQAINLTELMCKKPSIVVLSKKIEYTERSDVKSLIDEAVQKLCERAEEHPKTEVAVRR